MVAFGFRLAAVLLGQAFCLGQAICVDEDDRCSEQEPTSLLQVSMDARTRSIDRQNFQQRSIAKASEGVKDASASEGARASDGVMALEGVKASEGANATSKKNFTFMHVPYNFGNTVEKVGLYNSSVDRWKMAFDMTVAGGGQFAKGSVTSWDTIESVKRPGGQVWGHMNPDLQVTSNVSGCPMYLTPAKYWPEDLVTTYIGDKTVVGILRDPYERLASQFRGCLPGYGSCDLWDLVRCDVNADIKETLKNYIASGNKFDNGCTLLPQSEYWEKPHGITRTVSNWLFPDSMNEVFNDFGYDDMRINQSDILHVFLCPNSWSGDFDSETRALIRQVYQSDFHLLCQEFGYCDYDENVCLQEVQGMCPDKAFVWDDAKQIYCPTPETLANASLNLRVNPKCGTS